MEGVESNARLGSNPEAGVGVFQAGDDVPTSIGRAPELTNGGAKLVWAGDRRA